MESVNEDDGCSLRNETLNLNVNSFWIVCLFGRDECSERVFTLEMDTQQLHTWRRKNCNITFFNLYISLNYSTKLNNWGNSWEFPKFRNCKRRVSSWARLFHENSLLGPIPLVNSIALINNSNWIRVNCSTLSTARLRGLLQIMPLRKALESWWWPNYRPTSSGHTRAYNQYVPVATLGRHS